MPGGSVCSSIWNAKGTSSDAESWAVAPSPKRWRRERRRRSSAGERFVQSFGKSARDEGTSAAILRRPWVSRPGRLYDKLLRRSVSQPVRARGGGWTRRARQNRLISVVKLLDECWHGAEEDLLKSKTGSRAQTVGGAGSFERPCDPSAGGRILGRPAGHQRSAVGRQRGFAPPLPFHPIGRRVHAEGSGQPQRNLRHRDARHRAATGAGRRDSDRRLGVLLSGGPERQPRPRKTAASPSTRELRFEESLYLSSDDHTILPPSARALHDLRTLLRVSTMLHSFRGLHDTTSASAAEILRSHLTSLLLDLIPASHAAIFIPGAHIGRRGHAQPSGVGANHRASGS